MPYRVLFGGMLNGVPRAGGDVLSDAEAEDIANLSILLATGYLQKEDVGAESEPEPPPRPAANPVPRKTQRGR